MKLRKKKAKDRLYTRIEDWKNTNGDCKRKHPNGYKQPGRNY